MEDKKNFKQAKDKLQKAIEDSLQEMGIFIVAESQMRTSVDTGTLRRGETFKAEDKTLYVGSNVPYDEFDEFGTSRRAANPHWTPAVMENLDEINKILKKHLKKVGDE